MWYPFIALTCVIPMAALSSHSYQLLFPFLENQLLQPTQSTVL